MTGEFCEETVDELHDSEVWGLFCTDSFGMVSFHVKFEGYLTHRAKGMDISDIKVVVQFKATCNLCTLWQWFRRAAQGLAYTVMAILLVEKKDTTEEHQLREEQVKKKAKN